MKIVVATINDFYIVKNIVLNTINSTYPKFYSPVIVDFFINHHHDDAIKKDIMDNNVYLLSNDKSFIATATINENHINRLFVLPSYQKQGYGTFLINEMERIINQKFTFSILDSSIPGYNMYIKRGYILVKKCHINLNENEVLNYCLMKKEFLKQ